MEHLVFEPDASEELRYAYTAEVLETDWTRFDNLFDFVEPLTPWLGFSHDSIPLGKFMDYPKSAGYEIAKIWNGDFGDSHNMMKSQPAFEVGRRVASLLQAWLSIGLMECVIGKKIHASYLVRRARDGTQCLYTRNLHFCLHARVVQIRQGRVDKAKTNEEMQQWIQEVNKWTTRFTCWSHPSFRPKMDGPYPGFMDLIESITPAIVRIAGVVEQTRLYVLPDYEHTGQLTWQLPFNVVERRRDSLRALGWCPFQIKFMEDTLTQSVVDWILATHFQQDPIGHEGCTAIACARSDIDRRTYRQSHCCQDEHLCARLFPDMGSVVKILNADMIPIVSLKQDSSGSTLQVKGSSRSEAGLYIAFSHVWADGLGGATEEGLHRCQVERLDKLCRLHAESGWFWLDAICIPSRATVGDAVYFKALVAIRDVYLQAKTVLVLDRTIEKCDSKASTESLYAHIYLSSWMLRMWTYEEAVLARDLVFVLADGFHRYSLQTQPWMRRTVCTVWQSLASQLYRLRVVPGELTIGHIYRAFRYRLTNVPAEEFLSVSGMLGLDTGKLLSVKGEERARQFWLMLRTVPHDIPFAMCPKMTLNGFRWAPATMMWPSQTGLDTAPNGRKVFCTKEGLVGEYVVFELNTTLKGSARDRSSIFNIWSNGCSAPELGAWAGPGLLRVYCVDSWPAAPATHDFNILYMAKASGDILSQGQWVAAAAALGERRELGGDSGRIRAVKHIDRVLVERLQNAELSQSPASIMFAGRERTRMHASGNSNLEEICIS